MPTSNQQKVVSQKFVDDFELVAAYYQLRECGEYELVKKNARDDLENAIPCFAEQAANIRFWIS